MRTIINAQGCLSNPGPTGLTIDGDIIVSNVDLLKEIKNLKDREAALSKKYDECAHECNKLEDKIQKLTSLLEKQTSELETKIKGLSELAGKKPGKPKAGDSDEDK